MTSVARRGMPGAGNPQIRFDEGEVASGMPRRVSLLHGNRILAAGLALGSALALNAADLTDANYVANEGASPYAWETVANWQRKDGTSLAALPGADDWAKIGSAFADATFTVSSAVSVGGFTFAVPGGTLEIEDGGTLGFKHSNNYFADSADNCTLHVKPGGVLNCANYMRFGFNTATGALLLIDEGGEFSNGNIFYLGCGKACDARIENHGTMTLGANFYVGYHGGKATSVTGVIDNYATLTSRSTGSNFLRLGSQYNGIGILTNHVGATADLMMGVVVGAASNSVGRLVNLGTFKESRTFSVGGDEALCTNVTSKYYPTGAFVNGSNAVAWIGGELHVGNIKYGRGLIENFGQLDIGSANARLGFSTSSQCAVTNHASGTLTFSNAVQVAYYEDATLVNDGTLVFEGTSAPEIGYRGNGAVGTVQIRGDGILRGNKAGVNIAMKNDGAVGHVEMSGNARIENSGAIKMATGLKSEASLTLCDNARIDAPSSLYIGIGRDTATTQDWKQRATVTLRDNSAITNLNSHVYVTSNAYAKGQLVICDNAMLHFSNKSGTRRLYIGCWLKDDDNSWGELRLRGGSVMMSTNGYLYVGKSAETANICRSFLAGWGTVTRHNLEKTGSYDGINMTIHGGAVVADGEGEAHDLDLSRVRKVNDSSGLGDNNSGTNGWYAINKGRLTYPCRWSKNAYKSLGEYYSRTEPKFVNSVSFTFASGKDGYLIGQLYATDRDDIPAGLPADDPEAKTLRLGVWRATVNKSYELDEVSKENAGAVASADVRIRYNNFLLNALKDADGNLPDNLRLKFYRHDGTASGRWVRAGGVSAATAEAGGHLVGGRLVKSDGDWNLGFFAVVAEPVCGGMILIR